MSCSWVHSGEAGPGMRTHNLAVSVCSLQATLCRSNLWDWTLAPLD